MGVTLYSGAFLFFSAVGFLLYLGVLNPSALTCVHFASCERLPWANTGMGVFIFFHLLNSCGC